MSLCSLFPTLMLHPRTPHVLLPHTQTRLLGLLPWVLCKLSKNLTGFTLIFKSHLWTSNYITLLPHWYYSYLAHHGKDGGFPRFCKQMCIFLETFLPLYFLEYVFSSCLLMKIFFLWVPSPHSWKDFWTVSYQQLVFHLLLNLLLSEYIYFWSHM